MKKIIALLLLTSFLVFGCFGLVMGDEVDNTKPYPPIVTTGGPDWGDD